MLGYAERTRGPRRRSRPWASCEPATSPAAPATGCSKSWGDRSRFVKPFGVRVDLDELERVLFEQGVVALCTGDDD